MNKTVNINLAGVLFHIDEDAFLKLKNYLDTIRHSISDPQGRVEILQDIEARIAELFSEKQKNPQQVVNLLLVEEVMGIMGKPEDYVLDDDPFEEEAKTQQQDYKKTSKKLYRDPDNSKVAGVCAGMGHYFHIDPLWVRIVFLTFLLLSWGGIVPVYVVLWILVPEARTTAEKLEMRGEPINISNIERKVKEGFDTVADKVKGVDYKKYGNSFQKNAGGFFNNLEHFLVTVLKGIAKLVGILLILFAGTLLIAFLFSLFAVGTFRIVDAPWMDYVELANIGAPLWLVSLFIFFVAAIPLFFLLILGLKILSNRMKSIGMPAKLTLLGIWLLSIFALSFLGIRQATERAFEGKVSQTERLPLQTTDTLILNMRGSADYGTENLQNRDSDFSIKTNKNGERIIYSEDVDLLVLPTKDGQAEITITKSADGKGFNQAHEQADAISYDYNLQGKTLSLDGFFTTAGENLFRDQEVLVTLYLPEGMVLLPNKNTREYSRHYRSILHSGQEGHYLKIANDAARCLDCKTSGKNLNSNNNDEAETYSDEWYHEPTDSLSEKSTNNKLKDSILE